MPLMKGYSRKARGKNIGAEMKAGKPRRKLSICLLYMFQENLERNLQRLQ